MPYFWITLTTIVLFVHFHIKHRQIWLSDNRPKNIHWKFFVYETTLLISLFFHFRIFSIVPKCSMCCPFSGLFFCFVLVHSFSFYLWMLKSHCFSFAYWHELRRKFKFRFFYVLSLLLLLLFFWTIEYFFPFWIAFPCLMCVSCISIFQLIHSNLVIFFLLPTLFLCVFQMQAHLFYYGAVVRPF